MAEQELDQAEEEPAELVARAAAIDVAKDSGMVCTRVPHESRAGRRVQKVWDVTARFAAVVELADHLRCEGIERVVLEATSDYWRIWFYLLEAAGLQVWLVNARDVKNVPGRPKTDKLDSIWLCKLNERGMLRPSFVPPEEIRDLRALTRLRTTLTAECSRRKQRAEKILEDALVKVSAVVSDLFGKSGRAMMRALVSGERDPKVLAGLALGRLRPSRRSWPRRSPGGSGTSTPMRSACCWTSSRPWKPGSPSWTPRSRRTWRHCPACRRPAFPAA
jgi:transposase